MSQLAIDYSYVHPNPQAIADAGYQTVLRYISTYPPKDVTAAEALSLHAVGLSLGLIWETSTQAALGGGQEGQADGTQAVAMATALGYSKGCVIFTNIGDFAIDPGQVNTINAYLTNFRNVVVGQGYVCGAYGTGYIISMLDKYYDDVVWWQNAMNNNGVPGDVVISAASMYQRIKPTKVIVGTSTIDYDEDVIMAPVPFWGKAVIPPPPDPKGKENEMFVCEDSEHVGAWLVGSNPAAVGNVSHISHGSDVGPIMAACGQSGEVPVLSVDTLTHFNGGMIPTPLVPEPPS